MRSTTFPLFCSDPRAVTATGALETPTSTGALSSACPSVRPPFSMIMTATRRTRADTRWTPPPTSSTPSSATGRSRRTVELTLDIQTWCARRTRLSITLRNEVSRSHIFSDETDLNISVWVLDGEGSSGFVSYIELWAAHTFHCRAPAVLSGSCSAFASMICTSVAALSASSPDGPARTVHFGSGQPTFLKSQHVLPVVKNRPFSGTHIKSLWGELRLLHPLNTSSLLRTWFYSKTTSTTVLQAVM